MKVFLYFTRAYPWASASVLACLLVVGLLDALGLSTAFPVLSVAIGGTGGAAPTGFEGSVLAALERLSIPRELGPLVALMVIAFLLKAAILLLANRRVGYIVAHVATDLRLRLLRALLATRWSYYTRLPVGVPANAMASEANRASQAYYFGTQAAIHLLEAMIAAGIAFLVSWPATLAAGGAAAASVAGLHVFVRMSGRAGLRQTRLLRSLLGRMTDMLQVVKLLKATARESLVGPLLEEDTRKLNRAMQKQVLSKEALRSLQEPVLVAFGGAGLYATVKILGMAAPEALMLILLFAKTTSAVNKAQRKYQNLVQEESALWSLDEMIREAEEQRETVGGGATPTLERGVELRDVFLAYGERPVFEGLDLEIPAGSVTAIVGASGAGKTTIVDLVSGLLQPDAGVVLVDGVPLPEIDLRRWRHLIGYVPQEFLILHDTVRNNVTLGDPGVSDDDVETALRDAGVWDVVARLPEGLDASVGERGTLLSGGQRQRLGIARALAHRPRLLILDEATASLDADTEAAVWSVIAALRGKTTVVAISHQPALVGVADRLYRIEGGRATRGVAGSAEAAAGAR